MSQFHSLVVADIRRETEECVSLAFDIPKDLEPEFAFTPGQYLTLRIHRDGTELRRSYSICTGLDEGELRVAIKHVRGGAFSGFANLALAKGDRLDVMPPGGRFGPRIPAGSGEGRTCLGVAAGSGITPILSILKSMLEREPNSRFILLYGSRSTPSILFREQLEDLKDRFLGRLTVQHVLSREQQDIAALSGRIDAQRLRRLLPGLVDPTTIDEAFLCGPDTMIETIAAELAALGVPSDHVHSERFTSSTPATPHVVLAPAPQEAPAHTATIIHEGRSTEIGLAAGETVLDAATRAGLDLPWSCRGGMCSTCRARVTEGSAAMEVNFSLESWETEQGYVLTCQARPTTAHVTVDYDQI